MTVSSGSRALYRWQAPTARRIIATQKDCTAKTIFVCLSVQNGCVWHFRQTALSFATTFPQPSIFLRIGAAVPALPVSAAEQRFGGWTFNGCRRYMLLLHSWPSSAGNTLTKHKYLVQPHSKRLTYEPVLVGRAILKISSSLQRVTTL